MCSTFCYNISQSRLWQGMRDSEIRANAKVAGGKVIVSVYFVFSLSRISGLTLT